MIGRRKLRAALEGLGLSAERPLPAGFRSVPPEVVAVLDNDRPLQESGDDETVHVIDVRTSREWDRGHLARAVNIPHLDIVERIGEVTDDRDARIVLYCGVGQRAGVAKELLEEAGFTNVENAGGYEDAQRRFE